LNKKVKYISNSGYVAIVGRTNVGKSTFLNTILNVKVSIVSNKPQTTRNQILGIKTTPKGQIIFFDTPGIHRPFFKLNEQMMQDVHSSLSDADLILYFVEIDDKRIDTFAISILSRLNKKVILVVNKIDKYVKSRALERIQYFHDKFQWTEIVPISALKNLNLDTLEDLIFHNLPQNEHFYPEDQYTIQSEIFYVSEQIREKVLEFTRQELPFTTLVKVEEIKDKDKIVYVRANIHVETKSQKIIIVGKQGQMVKQIGETARKELEAYFDKKVFVDLFVKVSPKWRNSPHFLKQILN